jgi:uncharacterized SAM-binding protein YcdF (DUF218 family)
MRTASSRARPSCFSPNCFSNPAEPILAVLTSLPLLALLLYPPNVGLLLVVVAVILALAHYRRAAVILTLLGLIWPLLWSLPATTLYFGGKLESRYPYQTAESLPKADVIVVLGGNTQSNRANWFEPYNKATASDRLDRAAEIYFASRAPQILLSGSALEGKTSEARIMARVMRQKGIPDAVLLLENDGRNTHENAVHTLEMLKTHKLQSVLLVTSALHMPRAMASFAAEGVQAIAAGLPSQIVVPEDETIDPWIPNLRTLEGSRAIIKEYLGMFAYWLRGWI